MNGFTTATAAAAGRRSQEVIRLAKANGTYVQPWKNSPSALDVLRRVRAIDRKIKKARDPRALDCLTRSFERMFRCWAHLVGLPGAGNRRPGPERTAARRVFEAKLIEAKPTAEDTTGSGLEGDNSADSPK